METAPYKEWLDKSIVFLLEVNWGGFTYRFSTFPVIVTDGEKSYQFRGGLPDPEITLELQPGINPEGSSVPFALNFPVDISDKQAAYNLIDGASGILSYVFIKNNTVQQEYNNRFIIYKGIITNPIYGHPDKPKGYVEFSLEDKIEVEDIDILTAVCGKSGKINNADLTNEEKIAGSPLADIITGDFIFADDVHKGKQAPIVLGRSAFAYSSLSTMTARDIKNSPAYMIGHGVQYQHILIAGHLTDATNIKIYDSKGNSETGSITTWTNSSGDIFSFATYNYLTGALEEAWQVGKEDISYWAVWDTGGGLPSPYRSGSLEGGGDIIMWALSLAKVQMDYDNITSFMPQLNRYKFAGYINESVTPLEFLQEHIIAFLPVELSVGANGLRLIQNLFVTDQHIQPIETITADCSFYRSGAIQTESEPSNIINQITLEYAKSGMLDKYNNKIQITPDKTGAKWFESTTDYSYRSFQMFGRRSAEIQCDYVFDFATATQIAQDIVKANCFPVRSLEYIAAPKWGFLWVGDIIELTDSDIGLNAVKCQITGKQWTGTSWQYALKMENTG